MCLFQYCFLCYLLSSSSLLTLQTTVDKIISPQGPFSSCSGHLDHKSILKCFEKMRNVSIYAFMTTAEEDLVIWLKDPEELYHLYIYIYFYYHALNQMDLLYIHTCMVPYMANSWITVIMNFTCTCACVCMFVCTAYCKK